jgi:hypothetical protein
MIPAGISSALIAVDHTFFSGYNNLKLFGTITFANGTLDLKGLLR